MTHARPDRSAPAQRDRAELPDQTAGGRLGKCAARCQVALRSIWRCCQLLPMDVHRIAAWAQILGLPCAAYCAYGTWAALHPGEDLPVNSTALAMSLGALVICLLIVIFTRIFQRAPILPPSVGGHRSAEVAFARHWRGQAEGSADELQVALAENLEIAKQLQAVTKAVSESQTEAGALRKQLADEIAAKNEREGRLNLLQERYDAARNAANLHIPDVTGNVHTVRLKGRGFMVAGKNRTISCDLQIGLSLQSLGPESSEIRKLTITSRSGRAFRCLLNMLDTPIILKPENSYGFTVMAHVEFSDETNSIPRSLFLIATDSYNAHHWVPIDDASIPDLPAESLGGF